VCGVGKCRGCIFEYKLSKPIPKYNSGTKYPKPNHSKGA